MSKTCAIYTDPVFLDHDTGSHPESSARLVTCRKALEADENLQKACEWRTAKAASDEAILRCHTKEHLRRVDATAGLHGSLDPDTVHSPATSRAARLAAGCVSAAAEACYRGELKAAFCLVRPPGHHATPNRAMGFCFFNNVAIGAAHALAGHGLERVAIADFDLHHGNGTETIFADSPQVLVCSTYQHPLYPYTAPLERPTLVHCPLPAGTGGLGFRDAVETRWLPALEAFRPELLLVSAGFDGHREDPLGQLQLVEADYAWVSGRLLEVADRHASGRLVSVLEGGYALDALGRSAAAHVRVLLGL